MQVDTPLECGIWLTAAAQVGLSALVCCHEAFAMHQTAILLVVYRKLHHRDVSVLLNKKAGLQFGLVKCIHGTQYLPNSTWILCNLTSYVQNIVSSHSKHKSKTLLWSQQRTRNT